MDIHKKTPATVCGGDRGGDSVDLLNQGLQKYIKSLNLRQSLFCNSQKPPLSITGVTDTFLLSRLISLLDYFEFSLPFTDPSRAYSVLNISSAEFIRMERGLLGYADQFRCGSISVLSRGSSSMGVHVILRGQGCREYETRFGDSWIELIKRVKSAGGHFTRLDIAIDDRSGYFTVDQVHSKIQAGEFRSVFRTGGYRADYRFTKTGTERSGEGVYIGSKASSGLYLRIYDKAKEQNVPMHWVRTEVVARDERADLLTDKIIEGTALGQIALGVLSRCINFVDRSLDANKSRWAVCSWWTSFLGEVEKVRLSVEKVLKTIEEKADWIERQVAPVLSLLERKFGWAWGAYLEKLLRNGRSRWKQSHLLLLYGSGGAV